MTERICTSCGQLIPSARGKRICAACQSPIRRHDKWHFGGDGRVRHNDCTNTTGLPLSVPTTMPLIPEEA